MNYLPLTRTFEKVSQSSWSNTDIHLSTLMGYFGNAQTWEQIHKKPFVVVLGEAGVGKTEELRQQAEELRNDGHFAFYFTVSEVLQANRIPIKPGNEALLEAWRKSDQPAIFFWDSLDEGTLVSIKDPLTFFFNIVFEQLGKDWARVRWILSCRISSWNLLKRDGAIEEYLPNDFPEEQDDDIVSDLYFDSKKKVSEKEITVVSMRPLNIDQVVKLATHFGVDRPEDFRKAVESENYLSFAGRPRDLNWMVTYWNRNGGFGTLTAMIEESIKEGLKEKNIDRKLLEELDGSEARKWAERLGLSALMCKNDLFRLQNTNFSDELQEAALDPEEILPETSLNQRLHLFDRTLFDPSAFNLVKFHNRDVIEYLAAQWIINRLNDHIPNEELFEPFFGYSVQEPVLNPILEGVAGWVAAKSPYLLNRLFESSPETILFCGDSEQLRSSDVRKALIRVSQKYHSQPHLRLSSDNAALKRLAKKEIIPVIKEILSKYASAHEVKNLLLQIILVGEFTEFTEESYQMAIDNGETDMSRYYALKICKKFGTTEHKKGLKGHLCKNYSSMNRYGLSNFIEALFPEFLTIDDLIQIINKLKLDSDGRSELESIIRFHVVPNCPGDHLVRLFNTLFEMAIIASSKSPTSDSNRDFTESQWTVSPAVSVFIRIINYYGKRNKNAHLFLNLYRQIEKLTDLADIHYEQEIIDAFSSNPLARKDLFFEYLTRKTPEMLDPYVNLRIVEYTSEDLEWLLDVVSKNGNIVHKQVALDFAIKIWQQNENQPENKKRILNAINNEKTLLERTGRYFNPPKEHEWQRKKREAKQRREKEKSNEIKGWSDKIKGEIEALKKGENIEALNYLYRYVHERSKEKGFRYANTNWQILIEEFSQEIAEAYQQGLQNIWGKYTPSLPVKTNQNNYSLIRLGLSGISLMFIERGEDFNLTEEEGEKILIYGLYEISELPDWFFHIAGKYPDVFSNVIKHQLEYEFQDKDSMDCILSYLKKISQSLATSLAPILQDLLGKFPIIYPKKLEYSLQIMAGAYQQVPASLMELIVSRVNKLKDEKEIPLMTRWLKLWLHYDQEEAWNIIEKIARKKHIDTSKLAESLAAILDGSYRSTYLKELPQNLSAVTLYKMIRFFYAFVSPDKDIEFKNGALDSRHKAQSFRDRLFNLLADRPGVESYRFLLKLANDPMLLSHREWILILANSHQRNAARHSPWSEKKLYEYEKKYGLSPNTDKELFELVLSRLIKIKNDTEKGDDSEKPIFNSKVSNFKEYHLQIWLANRLQMLNRGFYSVFREPEIQNQYRKDILIHSPEVGNVVIELKRIKKQSYSFNDFRDHLNKLAEQYLKDANSRYGILWLGQIEKKNFRNDKNRIVDLEDAVKNLNIVAQEIVDQKEDIEDLRVVCLDFTP